MNSQRYPMQHAGVLLLGTIVCLSGTAQMTQVEHHPAAKLAFVGSVPAGTTFDARL